MLRRKRVNKFIKIGLTSVLLSGAFLIISSFKYASVDVPPSSNTGKIKGKVIVLDAGHGGKDPGAVGKLSREKDIALDITLKLGKKLEAEIPGTKVIYTRKTDVYPNLYERPALANKHHADLFVSIHLNSGGETTRRVKNKKGHWVTQKVLNTAVKGTETFVLGYNSMENQDVAIRENASILLEDNHEDNYGGFDPKDPASYIVFKILKRKYRDQSIRLAKLMQTEYSKIGRANRGIKELPLAVLKTAGMPAVLTEVGFISNSEEEKYLMSDKGQDAIVNSLFNAIKKF
ncbi:MULTISPECIES: N-acetylmuramoyl-L-alanine amidase [Sphingobacterium]|uniref:N-acetylmuramoyl-L-alanine amidase n=1 Tax=Sphingobacterium litopenaei TaxID=2763500 RepID=A0ABR7YG69_9SPHI|nr:MULTISPECIES: N-acetylmuramoyl-L-alanine amidase [Sphingobacterium]MBD1430280.1 N-acetylmuramoyl-L-alanine amidase [Sphingobacterium litopenaei]NGM74479.1 N-acetylmuramoyl-L-alanine amidase [Sphingobacterium sp. SGL-16]